MTYNEAIKKAQAYKHIGLENVNGEKVVPFNQVRKRPDLARLKKVAYDLGEGTLVATDAMKSKPMRFEFRPKIVDVKPESGLSQQPVVDLMSTDLYKQLQDLQKAHLDAELRAERAEAKCAILEKQLDELYAEELKDEPAQDEQPPWWAGFLENLSEKATPFLAQQAESKEQAILHEQIKMLHQTDPKAAALLIKRSYNLEEEASESEND